jgi:hypothetical protein
MNEVEIAQKLYDEAAAAYAESSAAYEAALMSTGVPRGSEVAERYRRAGDEAAGALQALVRARKALAPGFEALLTDPAVQVDPQGEVLDSILSYSSAAPASAGLPVAGAQLYDLPDRTARTARSSRGQLAGATAGYASPGRRTAAAG